MTLGSLWSSLSNMKDFRKFMTSLSDMKYLTKFVVSTEQYEGRSEVKQYEGP